MRRRFESGHVDDNMKISTTPVVERDRPVSLISNPESPGDRLRRRNATEATVRHLLPALGLDELRVVETVVSRLVMARRQYGELDLDSDTRDFRIEGGEEMADFLFYAAAREVAAMDRRLDRLRCAAADELARMQPVEFGLREFVNTAADYPSAHEIDLGGEAG